MVQATLLQVQGESPTYLLTENTHPVIRATEVSHTACKDEFRRNLIFDLPGGVYFYFYNNGSRRHFALVCLLALSHSGRHERTAFMKFAASCRADFRLFSCACDTQILWLSDLGLCLRAVRLSTGSEMYIEGKGKKNKRPRIGPEKYVSTL